MRSLVPFAALLLTGRAVRSAAAEDPPKPPAVPKPAEKAAEPDYKGPEIHWVMSLADAAEEAVQRNVLLYIHSHGST